jgi:hypothetical protein
MRYGIKTKHIFNQDWYTVYRFKSKAAADKWLLEPMPKECRKKITDSRADAVALAGEKEVEECEELPCWEDVFLTRREQRELEEQERNKK